ncbi:MAG: universal stress protein [Proteobacteria bacterium]|nr:universal stress protein [Pseudomonadota bacterium]MBU1586177.1 universal stress protein [Pseudomonadota bacterium]MBU2631992.1 universal stress protein [Pseudomonadota bacterium]
MDKKIHKILACVDFSDFSLMVLEYAVELAKAPNTEIVVLNVINQRDINSIQMAVPYFPAAFTNGIDVEEYIKTLKKDRNEKLKLLIKENFLNEKSMMSIKIDTGVPFECILKAIETEDIDLVVLANKGRGNISRVLFGSAAEKVFRHSPIPVVSVRDRDKFKREK